MKKIVLVLALSFVSATAAVAQQTPAATPAPTPTPVSAADRAAYDAAFQESLLKPIDPPTLVRYAEAAIKIGDPVSWPKAQLEIETSGGTVECVTEQEIADAKAVIGASGIGCEPASAASLAGAKTSGSSSLTFTGRLTR